MSVQIIDFDSEWGVVIVEVNDRPIAYARHKCGGWTPPIRTITGKCNNCRADVPDGILKKIRAYNFIGGFNG